MSTGPKQALGLKVIGDDVTEAEAEHIRDRVEEALGEEYRVLIYSSKVDLVSLEDLIERLEAIHAPE